MKYGTIIHFPEEPLPGPTGEHYRNDIGYADAFARRYHERARYIREEERWLVFDPATGWQRDLSGLGIRRMATDFARELYAGALERNREGGTDFASLREAADLGNLSRIRHMLAVAECHPQLVVNSTELDRDPCLVGVENGSVNLVFREFQPHHADVLVTRRMAVRYEPEAAAPVFERFLAEVQPDAAVRGFLQRWAGYCLSGSIREHVLPFHYGTGSNGKSLFLEHVLLRLLGEYGAKMTDALVYKGGHNNPPILEIAGLCGRRLALGEENTAGANLNENFLKSATGGDRQKGRFLYASHVEYDPTAKLALVGNHRPGVEGRDHGFWRRFLLVDWPVCIPNERQDVTLPARLRAEFPGILNWCLTGARDWLEHGLNPPAACLAATEKFRTESDSLAGFLELFQSVPGHAAPKSEVYDLYTQWASEEGIPAARHLSKRGLGRSLRDRGWLDARKGRDNQHVWNDIAPRDPMRL